MVLQTGLSLIGYNGSSITLADAAWKNNVAVIYKINSGRSGWISFRPSSTFNSLTAMDNEGHYLISVTTQFDLEGANPAHAEGGEPLPDGLLIMDGEQLIMA